MAVYGQWSRRHSRSSAGREAFEIGPRSHRPGKTVLIVADEHASTAQP